MSIVEPSVEIRRRKLQYFLSRLDRLEAKVNEVANPYDDLKDIIGFLKGAAGEYIGDLQKEIEANQRRIDELEGENEELKKRLKKHEKEADIKPAEEAHPTVVKKPKEG